MIALREENDVDADGGTALPNGVNGVPKGKCTLTLSIAGRALMVRRGGISNGRTVEPPASATAEAVPLPPLDDQHTKLGEELPVAQFCTAYSHVNRYASNKQRLRRIFPIGITTGQSQT